MKTDDLDGAMLAGRRSGKSGFHRDMLEQGLAKAARDAVEANPGDQVLWAEVERDYSLEHVRLDAVGMPSPPECECCQEYIPPYKDESRWFVWVCRVHYETKHFPAAYLRLCSDCADSWQAMIRVDNIPDRYGYENDRQRASIPVGLPTLANLEQRLDALHDAIASKITDAQDSELRSIRGALMMMQRNK